MKTQITVMSVTCLLVVLALGYCCFEQRRTRAAIEAWTVAQADRNQELTSVIYIAGIQTSATTFRNANETTEELREHHKELITSE